MAARILALLGTALLAAVFFYLSRYWFLNLWPREGLLVIGALDPRGGLLQRWLAGTDLRPFELLIWAGGVFLSLTGLHTLGEWLAARLPASSEPARERENGPD